MTKFEDVVYNWPRNRINEVGALRGQRHIPNPGRFVSFTVFYFLKSDQDTVKGIPAVFNLEFPHGVVSLRFFQTINSHGRLNTVERSLKLISEVDLAPEITEVYKRLAGGVGSLSQNVCPAKPLCRKWKVVV